MKRNRLHRAPWLVLGIVALCLMIPPRAAWAQIEPDCETAVSDTLLTPDQWASFTANLERALHMGNEGCQVGALRQIIRYGAFMEFDRETVFDVMRIYRNQQNEKMRRMAVLALGQMNDRWAIEFLDMLARYEASPTLQKTMKDVVADYWAKHGGQPS